MVITLQDAKYDCFAVSASSAFSFDALAAEVRFIDFYNTGDREFGSLSFFCDAVTKTQIQRVRCSY